MFYLLKCPLKTIYGAAGSHTIMQLKQGGGCPRKTLFKNPHCTLSAYSTKLAASW